MEQAEPIAGASQPTISRWERGESVQCLVYAIRLAQRVPAARSAFARLIGATLAVVPSAEDRKLAELTYRVAVARRRADWGRVEASLDAVLPALRQSDHVGARQQIADLLRDLSDLSDVQSVDEGGEE